MSLAAMEDKRAKSICKVFHSLAHDVALAPLVPQGGLQCFSPALAGVHIHIYDTLRKCPDLINESTRAEGSVNFQITL